MSIKKHHTIRAWIPVFAACVLVFILANCARESRPTGGLKDTLAPVVLWEKPLNNSVSVMPQKIVIKFDEAVTLDKVQEKCIISPALDEFPSITVKNKKVIISLEKTNLEANTTYNFSFTNAIKDVNEGNALESYSYAFSTSSVIDSFKIAGKVQYAHNLQVPKSAFVVLHSNLDDSAFTHNKPKYITQTSKEGKFELNHIAPGTYKIYALEDANNDYMFNQAHEKIAFYDSLITPSASIGIDTVWYKRFNDSIPQSVDSFVVQTKTRWSHQDIVLQLFTNSKSELEITNAKRISQFAYGWKFSRHVTANDFSVSIPQCSEQAFTSEILKDSVILWLLDTALIRKPETTILVSSGTKTDSLKMLAFKDAPSRLLCDKTKTKSTIFPSDTIRLALQRPIAKAEVQNIYIALVKDSVIYANMWNKPHTLNAENMPVITVQYPPLQALYVQKYFYQKQELVSYKTGQNRVALYFAQPIQVSDVTLQLELFPNLQSWYVLEYDATTNALLCWITNADVMKLKNICFTVQFISEGKQQTKTIEFAPGFSKKDSFKKVKSTKLVPDLLESQKKEVLLDNAILIVCNNPIKEFKPEMFSLIATTDSLQTQCITKIEQSGLRSLLVYYTAKPAQMHVLTVQKEAITDIYGAQNKEKSFELQTQKKNSTKLYTPVITNVTNIGIRDYGIQAPKVSGSYALLVPQATFTDEYGALNDSCEFFFQIPKPDSYGTLKIVVTPYNPDILLRLYKKDSKSKEADYEQILSNQGVYTFSYVQPGEYQVQAVFDQNNNKTWDSGSFERKQQAEKILFLDTPVIIKANWDNVIQWKMEK